MFMKWNWNNTAASRLRNINVSQRQLVPTTNRSILSTQQNKETHLENIDAFFMATKITDSIYQQSE